LGGLIQQLAIAHLLANESHLTSTFTVTSPRGKSWTQIMKVADTNHLDMSRCLRQSLWQVRDKFKFSPLQCTEKVGDKVGGHKSWQSATWFVSRTFMVCVRDTSATLSGTCPGLCRKVGVMEFGLLIAWAVGWSNSAACYNSTLACQWIARHVINDSGGLVVYQTISISVACVIYGLQSRYPAIPAVFANPESWDWRYPNPGISKLQKLVKIIPFRVLNNTNKNFSVLIIKICYLC